MAGPRRRPFRFPRRGYGFRGEDSTEGLTDEKFQSGFLARCRNYHLVGRGRLQKREGWKEHISSAINGSNPINGLFEWDSQTARYLIAAAGGSIKYIDGTTPTDLTGAATFASGAENGIRFEQYNQGSNLYLLATDGTNPIAKCVPGTDTFVPWMQNVVDAPSTAQDIAVFYDYVVCLNTSGGDQDNGPTALEWGPNNGVLDNWDARNIQHCSRRSHGMALSLHGEQALLVFHRHSIHHMRFIPEAGESFAFFPTDETVGLAAKEGVVHSKGRTYFVYDDGIYMISNPQQKAEYISAPIEDFWGQLNKERIQHITAFERGEPWNEIIFHVTTAGETQHNKYIVLQTELGAFSIFDSPSGAIKFSRGITYRDANNDHTTILGGYDSMLAEAWGDNNNSAGYLDGGTDGAAVQSELKTGLLNLGYEGLSRLREIWWDILAYNGKYFDVQIIGLEEDPTLSQADIAMGVAGSALSVSFFFDQSVLAAESPGGLRIARGTDGDGNEWNINAKSRYFQCSLIENNEDRPHVVNSSIWLSKDRSMRFRGNT